MGKGEPEAVGEAPAGSLRGKGVVIAVSPDSA